MYLYLKNLIKIKIKKPNTRQKMGILNSLIVLKNLKGGTLPDFFTSNLLQNIKKMKTDPLETLKSFQKSLTKPKKGGWKSHSAEKREREILLLWNGFVFHVRGFGCVQNQIQSTYGNSALCTKSGPIALN